MAFFRKKEKTIDEKIIHYANAPVRATMLTASQIAYNLKIILKAVLFFTFISPIFYIFFANADAKITLKLFQNLYIETFFIAFVPITYLFFRFFLFCVKFVFK